MHRESSFVYSSSSSRACKLRLSCDSGTFLRVALTGYNHCVEERGGAANTQNPDTWYPETSEEPLQVLICVCLVLIWS